MTEPKSPADYRPISVLPILSKVYEKVCSITNYNLCRK